MQSKSIVEKEPMLTHPKQLVGRSGGHVGMAGEVCAELP